MNRVSDLKQRVGLDFLLSLKDGSFKYCLSDGVSFGGLRYLAGLFSHPFKAFLLILCVFSPFVILRLLVVRFIDSIIGRLLGD